MHESVDNEYLEHWYTIINPLEKLLDMKCIAFDPDILLLEAGPKGLSIVLPLWFAKKLCSRGGMAYTSDSKSDLGN